MKNNLRLSAYASLIIICLPVLLLGQADWNTQGNSINSGDWLGSSNNLGFTIKTNNTDRISILAGGNVGIGLTAPTNLFQVHDGVIQVTNSTTGTGGSHGLLFGCDGLNVQFKQQENAPMLFLVNSATPRMNIAPGGFVAIGNGSTAANRLLDLKDNTYQLRITYDANNYSDIGTNCYRLTPFKPSRLWRHTEDRPCSGQYRQIIIASSQ